jgi:hypothetical protein
MPAWHSVPRLSYATAFGTRDRSQSNFTVDIASLGWVRVQCHNSFTCHRVVVWLFRFLVAG